MDPLAAATALRALVAQADTELAATRHLVTAARALRSAGRTTDAEALYRDVVATRPKDVAVVRELIEMLADQERWDDVRALLLSALAMAPDEAWVHHTFARASPGSVYLSRVWPAKDGPVPRSIEAATGVLANNALPSRTRLLGHLLLASGRPARAADVYAALGPPGRALQAEALRYAGLAVKADVISGCARVRSGDFARGEALLRRSIERGEGTAEAYAHLVTAVEHRHAYDGALTVAREGLRAWPRDVVLRRAVPRLLIKMNRTAEAQHVATRIGRTGSADGRLDHTALLGLPIVYDGVDDVDATRGRFEAGLERLEGTVDPSDLDRWGGLLLTDNFYLGYQAHDDRALQERFSALVGRVARTAAPGAAVAAGRTGRRLRVGFVSPFLRGHTVGRLFSSWITERDRDRVEAVLYTVGAGDMQTGIVRMSADESRILRTGPDAPAITARAAEMIRGDALDVLVYPSVGMSGLMTTLASLRLAPLQAASWGHPVTTGSREIDAFLSSELMEPPGAEVHYTERLVRLPGIGVCVARPPAAEPVPRSGFGLRDDDIVYLCSQSLFKLHPADDGVYAQIAARVSGSVVAFIEHPSDRVTEMVYRRLARAFEAGGADPDQQLVFVPRLSPRRFRSLNAAADVYLDTPQWSGGMTTFEAVGVGLPPVTWPGPLMRGRHTAAILWQLGLDELVATSLSGYVDLAVALGADTARRETLRSEIRERSGQVFGDTRSVWALETFMSQAQ